MRLPPLLLEVLAMTASAIICYYLIIGAVTVAVDLLFAGEDAAEDATHYPPFSPRFVYTVMVVYGVVAWPVVVRDWFRND